MLMAYLACVGQGRRVQTSFESEKAEDSASDSEQSISLSPLKALATSLLASSPASAFNVATNPGVSVMTRPPHRAPAMSMHEQSKEKLTASSVDPARVKSLGMSQAAMAAGLLAAFGLPHIANAARSGGRVGGRMSGGGGGMRGGGGYSRGGYSGGGSTNIYMSPGIGMSPFGFSPFGSPFGYSPFGFSPFGFGFGIPTPLLLFAIAAIALQSFRESRMGEVDDAPGAVLCLQVAAYCASRSGDSLYARLSKIARSADTTSYEGLQALASDSTLAMLRSSKDWLAARTVSETKGLFNNEVDAAYNRLLVTERAKWESEQQSLKRTLTGQPTYMVATLVVLLREGKELPEISNQATLREAIQELAAEVSVEDNLLGAELLWTPEDNNDVMEKDDMFLNFPELITV